ncbi:MAG TPA: hypothetical protein VEG36_04545, partial [Burkholderiales bacterium]|nr:hypothetical protein [Burkholderiales bacterium]
MRSLSWQRAALLCASAAAVALSSAAYSQELVPPGGVRVVDIVHPDQGAEMRRDSEPSVAVNPANPMQIAASAFTPAPSGSKAPIYVSTDGGLHWKLNKILPFNNSETGTGDITLRFGSSSNILYVAALKKTGSGDSAVRELKILRSRDFARSTSMDLLTDDDNEVADQPWVEAITTSTGSGTAQDRVYVGFSNECNCTNTPQIKRSLDAASWSQDPTINQKFDPTFPSVDRHGTCEDAGGPVRPAVHGSGVVYAAFFQFTGACDSSPGTASLIVVRDDTWVQGDVTEAYGALKEPSDQLRGKIVAQGFSIPWIVRNESSPPTLGGERITGHISLAVDPSDGQRVFVAWGQGTSASDYTLHLRSSSDGGQTWSGDLLTVPNALNPSVAINDRGTVGFLYQAFVAGDQWETHLVRSPGDFAASSRADIVLHKAGLPPHDTLGPKVAGGPLGDYNYLMAVGANFYGIFSGNNAPVLADFPLGVTYRRRADFTSGQLHAPDGSVVKASIDPFFFVASDPIPVDTCASQPQLCDSSPVLAKNLIKLSCPVRGCIVLDPVAENCQVKFTCPGCTKNGLCPPYYHIHLDGLKDVWRVGIFDESGNAVPHRQFKTRTGLVLSFRPGSAE